jgi:hypothetical protein
MKRIFASSGSCFKDVYKVYGKSKGIQFTSKEFSGTMDGPKFWEDLAAFAKAKDKYVELYS